MEKETVKYIGIYACIILLIWIGSVFFAKSISDYEVIEPENNVKCVVVSRAFNTSVDCWKVD